MKLFLIKWLALGCFVLLAACGGSGGAGISGFNGVAGQPCITAEVDSIKGTNSSNASILITDSNFGNPITNAVVTVNAVAMVYDATSQKYKGTLAVAPGSNVVLNVTIGGKTYSANGNQFSSYPVISSPKSNDTWQLALNNTVNWSGETPTTDSFYGIGVVNSNNGQFDWPTNNNNSLHVFQSTTGSYLIQANNLTVGNRTVILAIARQLPIADAASGSVLVISAFDAIPVTVVHDPGIFWSLSASNIYSYPYGITWAGNKFVAVGYSWQSSSGSVLTSLDGTTWSTLNLPASVPSLLNVVWSGSQLIAVGLNGSILSSPDAVIWTARTSNTTANLNRIAWSGAIFVAVGTGGTIVTSPDGITWTPRNSTTTQILNGIVWSGTQFVAVGASGTILTSPNGTTWTVQTSGNLSWLNSVAWSGSVFVAVGSKIYTSPDGITWTEQPSVNLFNLGLNDIAWSGTNFVAVGSGGNIFSSHDGVTWLYRSFTSADLYAVAWSGTRFVTAGNFHGIEIYLSQ